MPLDNSNTSTIVKVQQLVARTLLHVVERQGQIYSVMYAARRRANTRVREIVIVVHSLRIVLTASKTLRKLVVLCSCLTRFGLMVESEYSL
jgi:hypothetical protein